MGGSINASSVEGQGSVFTFTICLACADAQAVKSSSANKAAETLQGLESIQGCEILLVEDSPTNQIVAQGYLKKMQLNVTQAHNGLEAIQKVREKAFDAILMDIQMPIMDGYEATRQIRLLPEGLQLPIIAISASVMADVKKACLEAGMNDHLSKPLDFDELAACLRKWIIAKPSWFVPKEKHALTIRPVNDKEVDHQRLQILLKELEQQLADNMLDAKKVAEAIDSLLEETALFSDFIVVSHLVRKMSFKKALSALKDFNHQLANGKQ